LLSPYKQIPKALGEEELFPTFDSFGPLKDVAVIRDKHSGLHRGCAFVTYWTAADAERAREALHDKFTFPGARRAAQVKPAEPSGMCRLFRMPLFAVIVVFLSLIWHFSLALVPENKLFIGMLSRKAEEDEVRELFAPFGEIREIYMIRNADGTSKCAAFLRYVDREAAVQAIETLNSQVMMDGAARPLLVKFADNKHQKQQRQIRNVRRQELMVAMGPGGFPVYPPQGPPPMPMPGHGHPGPGPQYPMQPQPQYDPGPGGYPGHGAHHHPPPPHPYMYPPHQYGAPPPYAFQARQEAPVRQPNPRPREGPAGANLFVYHLPHDLTDADLATAFNPFGNVISAKVYVDKYTGESKGFGTSGNAFLCACASCNSLSPTSSRLH
jgi:CUG-BP- and ETR3-like factor